jgi:hypothetical protein
MTEDRNRTGVDAREPDNRIDRRGFARAVGPEQREKVAGRNVKRDPVDGDEPVVALDEIPNRDRGGRTRG